MAACTDGLLAHVEGLSVQADDLPLGHLAEHLGTDGVKQWDARLHQQLRPVVGVAPADARGHVHHGRDLPVQQRVGADPVQVLMVDDGDVTWRKPLGEVLGAAVQPCWPAHAGQALGPGPWRDGTLEKLGHHRFPSCQNRGRDVASPDHSRRCALPREGSSGVSALAVALSSALAVP